MSNGNDKSKEDKLIFKAIVVDNKLQIVLGAGVSQRDMVFASKMLDLQIENSIIASQRKKPTLHMPFPKKLRGRIFS